KGRPGRSDGGSVDLAIRIGARGDRRHSAKESLFAFLGSGLSRCQGSPREKTWTDGGRAEWRGWSCPPPPFRLRGSSAAWFPYIKKRLERGAAFWFMRSS